MKKAKLNQEQKLALAEQRRKDQIPKNRAYTVKLPDGKFHPVEAKFDDNKVSFTTALTGTKPVVCEFSFTNAKVERKVRLYGQVVREVISGKPVIVSVKLPATYVTLTLGDQTFTARSVCKPPDKFDRKMGIKFALRHLLKLKRIHEIFSQEDYEILTKVCLTKPPKPSQIARAQRIAKANAEQPKKKEAAK